MTFQPDNTSSRSTNRNAPQGWAKDRLSTYLEAAERNVLATFVKNGDTYKTFTEIDAIFRILVDGLTNTPNWFESIFILRAHSAFLSSIRLVMAGAVTESYATSRQAVEFALYGFYLYKHPELQKVWLTRTDSNEARAAVRDSFKISKMLKEAEASIPTFGDIARSIYEQTIDFGAHPNESSITTTIQIIKDEDARQLRTIYLHDADLPMRNAFKSVERVGVCILGVFQMVDSERYDLLGISPRLMSLTESLATKQ